MEALRLHLHGVLAALVTLPVLALDGDLAAQVPQLLLVMAVGLVPLGLVAVDATRRPAPGRGLLLPLLLWALVLRVILLSTEPSLSDDLFRYVWEGRLVAAGLDPFDLPPDAPSLTRLALDSPEWGRMNHRHLPAIYPPGVQWVFGLLAAVDPDPDLFRVALVVADLIVIALLAALLLLRRRDPRWAVLYAWHPLVVVEVASSGHYEPLALLPVLLGLLLWERRARLPAYGAWGLAVAAKYAGGAVAWFAARRQLRDDPAGAAAGLILAGLVPLLLGLPFALDGAPPLGSLTTYVEHWGHNASVHALLAELLGYHPARRVVGVLFLLWTASLLWLGPEPGRGFLLLFAGLVVLSPVVHPWYALWFVVLLPLYPSPGLLTLSALLPLSYLAWPQQAAGGAWAPPAWVPWVEYGAPLLVAAWAHRARRRGR